MHIQTSSHPDTPSKRRRRGNSGVFVGPLKAVRNCAPTFFKDLADETVRVIEKTKFGALQMLNEGRNAAETAPYFNVHPVTVATWAKTFQMEGVEGLREMPLAQRFYIGIDIEDVRSRVKTATDTRDRTCLVALVEMMEGGNQEVVVEKFGFVGVEFSEWVRRFKEFGVDYLNDRSAYPGFWFRNITLRSDFDGDDLRLAAEGYDDKGAVGRMLSIAMLYDGMSLSEIKDAGGLEYFQLRKAAERFNVEGIAGLTPQTAITKLRDDFDAGSVTAFAAARTDEETSKRCAAIAALYSGERSIEVAQRYGVSRASVHNWIVRFNEHGERWLDGSSSLHRGYTYSPLAPSMNGLTSSGRENPKRAQVASLTPAHLDIAEERLTRFLTSGRRLSLQVATSWINVEFDLELLKSQVLVLLRGIGFEVEDGVITGKRKRKAAEAEG